MNTTAPSRERAGYGRCGRLQARGCGRSEKESDALRGSAVSIWIPLGIFILSQNGYGEGGGGGKKYRKKDEPHGRGEGARPAPSQYWGMTAASSAPRRSRCGSHCSHWLIMIRGEGGCARAQPCRVWLLPPPRGISCFDCSQYCSWFASRGGRHKVLEL